MPDATKPKRDGLAPIVGLAKEARRAGAGIAALWQAGKAIGSVPGALMRAAKRAVPTTMPKGVDPRWEHPDDRRDRREG